MLSELRIRNFALIDNLTVRLAPGLNVLTGETGAGKSIVVGALALLLGERATAEVVRDGAERATVEGVFELGDRPDTVEWLEDHGFEPDAGAVILKREVAVEGRNRAWINGSPATASLLAELGAALVSLHGQHEHQTLLRRDEQRVVLDAFGANSELAEQVAAAHASLTTLEAEIAKLEERRRQAVQRADFLRFQVDEIEGAALLVGEEERLSEEAVRLAHADELITLAGSLVDALTADRNSATTRLGQVRRALDQLVRIDPSQRELLELFDTAYYAVEELGTRLQQYRADIDHDPDRLEQIRHRQDQIFRLRSKYGPTLENVLARLEEARTELSVIDDADWQIQGMRRQIDEARSQRAELSARLTERRLAAIDRLADEVNQVLPEIGMERGRFEVVLLPVEPPGAYGAEDVEFRISVNTGFEPRPLAHVASGGELSRVMLALTTILARLDAVPTLVFDEVDAGIGGRIALHVGDKMRQVAGSHQVLAITHLPQIASRAHRHLRVRKDEGREQAVTTISVLEADDRVQEIARMLGGDPESVTSLAHARELLERGRVVVGA